METTSETKIVLIVEDDTSIVRSLSQYLHTLGFSVEVCQDGSHALGVYHSVTPDLVILDLNLPGKDGLVVCEEIRALGNTPIIILSARDREEDRVYALEHGADDFVGKPFSPRELSARAQIVMRRASPEAHGRTGTFTHGRLTLDTDNFLVSADGEEIRMTKTEFQLLLYLLERAGRIVSREDLMRDILGYDNYLYDRTVDTHIKNLRKKV